MHRPTVVDRVASAARALAVEGEVYLCASVAQMAIQTYKKQKIKRVQGYTHTHTAAPCAVADPPRLLSALELQFPFLLLLALTLALNSCCCVNPQFRKFIHCRFRYTKKINAMRLLNILLFALRLKSSADGSPRLQTSARDITVCINARNADEQISIEVDSDASMADVISLVNQHLRTNDIFDALFSGQHVDDEELLSDVGIGAEACIELRHTTDEIKLVWNVLTNARDRHRLFRTAKYDQFRDHFPPLGMLLLHGRVEHINFNSLPEAQGELTVINWHALKGLSALSSLDLDNNNLSGTLDLSLLPESLVTLTANNNRFTSIHVAGLPRIYALSLTNNMVSLINWEAVKNLSSLYDLQMSQNSLSGLLDLGSLPPSLRTMLARDNHFTSLNIAPHHTLGKLDLSNNQIHSVTNFYQIDAYLPMLDELRLSNNNIEMQVTELPRVMHVILDSNLLRGDISTLALHGDQPYQVVDLSNNPEIQAKNFDPTNCLLLLALLLLFIINTL